ncbi:MAG TPA: XdhC family protein [Gemmatimonadaceae bacterium]|nr:XdhC family protein [Gemmatimonadaceae bacterium]
MHELDRIRLALAAAAERGEPALLATVVEVDGSTYRGAGARMVVRADGSTVGAVSGGCLEADIVARAAELIASGTSDVVHYDTRASDDVVMGLGLGCQGVIDVRLEPLAGQSLADEIARLTELRARDAVRLLVCGAGTDAIPVVRLAALTGWLVTVVDHRPAFATPERFPDAERVVCVNAARDPGALAEAVALDAMSAAVVMAHAATHDRAYLHALLGVGALRYIGVLGPRRRTLELLEGASGVRPSEIPPRVYAPVGLDLGAETPEEIALSIASEIAAVLAGRDGGSLKAHGGPIHANRIRTAERADLAH